MIGYSAFELLHPDDHALVVAAFASVTGKDVGTLIDVRIRDGQDQWRHCELRGRSIEAEDGSNPTIVVGFRDIADRQRLEFGAGNAELLRALVHHATSLLITLAEDISMRIRSSLTEPIVLDDEIIEIHASIGTSVTADQPTAVQLLAAADDSMYAVKRNRRRDDTTRALLNQRIARPIVTCGDHHEH